MTAKATRVRSTRPSKAASQPRHALQFLVALTNTTPLVWRRIQVPGDYSFWDLHVAIQDAMGWQDYHLHEFTVVHPESGALDRIGIPTPDVPDDRLCAAGWDVSIASYFNWQSLHQVPPAMYRYDFGDDWLHVVTFEDMTPRTRARYPRCLAGARACPPEDCGGVHGFAEFLQAVADPSDARHAELLRWAGGTYDPDAFDPKHVVFDNPRQRWKKAFER